MNTKNLDNHERVLKGILTSYAKQIRVAIPATIIEFDSSVQRAKVSIDIEEQFGESYEKPDILEDVPIAFPRVMGFVVTMPIKKGDKVMLIFAHSSIDKWCVNGESNNKDTRTHHISDAVAYIDSIRPENDPIKNFDEDNLVLRTIDNNIHIKIKKDKIKILGDVEIDGKLNVTKEIKSDIEVEAKSIKLTKHKHIGVTAGKDTTQTPIP
jgi:hypothetical protein